MLVLFAQHFVAVRREIDDDQPAAGRERPRRLAQRAGGVVEIVQNLMHDRQIEAVRVRPAARRCRPGAIAHCAGPPVRGARAPRRAWPAERSTPIALFGTRREQFEHAAGAAADVEQACDRRCAVDRRDDRGLDLGFRRVQRAISSQSGAVRRNIACARAARAARTSARRSRSAASAGSPGSSRARMSRASAAAGPFPATWKNAQAPSRWRSTSPASTSSFRWRDTRGCDWPRMATSSLTASSASASSA